MPDFLVIYLVLYCSPKASRYFHIALYADNFCLSEAPFISVLCMSSTIFFDGNTEVSDKDVLRSFTLYVGTPNAFKNKLREGSKSYVYQSPTCTESVSVPIFLVFSYNLLKEFFGNNFLAFGVTIEPPTQLIFAPKFVLLVRLVIGCICIIHPL